MPTQLIPPPTEHLRTIRLNHFIWVIAMFTTKACKDLMIVVGTNKDNLLNLIKMQKLFPLTMIASLFCSVIVTEVTTVLQTILPITATFIFML